MANNCYNTMFVEGKEKNIDQLEEWVEGTPDDAWPKHLLSNIGDWGTKWLETIDLDRDEKETLSLHFLSAWAPPIPVYQKLKEMGYIVYATYCETGCGFLGMWIDGQHWEYDLSQIGKENYRDVIHEELLKRYSDELEVYYDA